MEVKNRPSQFWKKSRRASCLSARVSNEPPPGVGCSVGQALAAAEEVQLTLETGTVAGIVRAAAPLLQLLRTDAARGDLVGCMLERLVGARGGLAG
jgi:hypothetical protein